MAKPKKNPFEFHGVSLSTSNDHATADCPYCLKEAKFYINTETNQWDCKSCGESGNLYTFLAYLHEFSLRENTKVSDYKDIADSRGLPWQTLKRFGLARSFLTDNWLLPTWNRKKKLTYLLVYDVNRF